jgi:hypothetical protein
MKEDGDMLGRRRNRNACPLLVDCKMVQTCGTLFGTSSKYPTQSYPWPSDCILRHVPKTIENIFTTICPQISMATVFIMAKKWIKSKCPSTGGWKSRRWDGHAVECYLALYRNGVPTRVTTWVDISVVLCERATHKGPVTSPTWRVCNRHGHRVRGILAVADSEERTTGVSAGGDGFLLGDEMS